ncbi:MAG: hypothetical protein ACYDGR_17765 [Candidatus Dormibacteria bacterium]
MGDWLRDNWDLLAFALVGGVCVYATWRLNLHVSPTVAAIRRNLRIRGKVDERPVVERLSDRYTLVRRLENEANMQRLLAIAGRDESPGLFLVRGLVIGVAFLLLVLVVDVVGAGPGGPPIPFWVGVLGAGIVGALQYAQLRTQASRRQRAMDQEVAEMFDLLGVITGNTASAVEKTLILLASCTEDQALYSLLKDEGWRKLVDGQPRTEHALYAMVAEAYGVPQLRVLSDVVKSVNVRGLAALPAFTGAAESASSDQLANQREESRKAEIRLRVPIALLILPILGLILAPLAAALATGLKGG